MEVVTELHRKTLIQLMSSDLERKPRRKQRSRTYGPEVDDILRVIDESYDYICAERITPNLVKMTEQLANHGEVEASDSTLEQLERISVSTVGRALRRIRQDTPRLPRQRPARSKKLTRNITMGRIPWDILAPGHFETDLVHHCGLTASGEYMRTLQMIDVLIGGEEMTICSISLSTKPLFRASLPYTFGSERAEASFDYAQDVL